MTTCIVQTPKPQVFESKELSFFKNSMSSLLPTITIFIGFILILRQKVELLTHSHSAKDQKHIYLPSSTLDLGSQFPSSSTTLDLQSHNQNTKRNQHCDLGQFHSSTTASDLHIHNPNTKRKLFWIRRRPCSQHSSLLSECTRLVSVLTWTTCCNSSRCQEFIQCESKEALPPFFM